jgi:cation diffusion facilitator CzcD-associated flavoprotein CzcO
MSDAASTEFVDVLVVGAGISGIGAAYHLQTRCPDHTFTVLEGRAELGGTWDLFRYPGVRSDSDMHTLGFGFKPWTAENSIAEGGAILDYLHETVDEFDIRRHIRFGHQVMRADWSTDDSSWTVTAVQSDTGDTVRIRCNFLSMCSGYYSYKGGYTPVFEGHHDFAGEIVHPQEWPADLDYAGKRVVIIGSGATAVTLVPSMAADAEHVTMLQRSPTWIVAMPDRDPINRVLRKLLPAKLAYRITRKKNMVGQERFYNATRKNPERIRKLLLKMAQRGLGPDHDLDPDFTPKYDPWDQRICLIPNGDLFKAVRNGDASVVTDHIDRFTPTGILLESGTELPADIIVTATGLQLVTLAEADFFVDGEAVDFSRTWTYKGLAYSDVPNLVSTFGYINASWTLRADMTAEYVCRLLNHMGATGTTQCTPRLRPSDLNMTERPFIDDFSAGYMQRVMPLLPRQGDRAPWLNTQRVSEDQALIRDADIDDGVMQFVPAPARVRV